MEKFRVDLTVLRKNGDEHVMETEVLSHNPIGAANVALAELHRSMTEVGMVLTVEVMTPRPDMTGRSGR